MSNDGVQEHNHLYSMGLLPKIQGRYLSSHKMIPRVKEKILKEKAPKIKQISQSLDIEKAKQRLNYELKRSKHLLNLSPTNKQKQQMSERFFDNELVHYRHSKISQPRIHTIQLNNAFNGQNSHLNYKIKMLYNHKKILSLHRSRLDGEYNSFLYNNALKIIKKKQTDISESLDKMRYRKKEQLRIKINTEPAQFHEQGSSRNDMSQCQLKKADIKLNLPFAHQKQQDNSSNLQFIKERRAKINSYRYQKKRQISQRSMQRSVESYRQASSMQKQGFYVNQQSESVEDCLHQLSQCVRNPNNDLNIISRWA